MKNIDTARRETFAPNSSLIGTTVIDRNGNRAEITSLYRKEDATFAVLTLNDGRTIDADLSEFERHDGSFFTPALLDARNENPTSSQPEWHEEMTISLAKEEIGIEKRRVDTGKGIRVTKHVLEHDEIVNVPHSTESLSVRHVESGQIVSEDNLPQPRQEGDTYIIPVFEEIYVVEKKIRLKEELHITREKKESKEDQKIKLRSEQIAVERFNDDPPRGDPPRE